MMQMKFDQCKVAKDKGMRLYEGCKKYNVGGMEIVSSSNVFRSDGLVLLDSTKIYFKWFDSTEILAN